MSDSGDGKDSSDPPPPDEKIHAQRGAARRGTARHGAARKSTTQLFLCEWRTLAWQHRCMAVFPVSASGKLASA